MASSIQTKVVAIDPNRPYKQRLTMAEEHHENILSILVAYHELLDGRSCFSHLLIFTACQHATTTKTIEDFDKGLQKLKDSRFVIVRHNNIYYNFSEKGFDTMVKQLKLYDCLVFDSVSSSASHLATGDVVELLPNSERISRAWIGKTVKVVQIVSEFAQVMVVDPETSPCEKTTWWRVDCMKRRSQLPMLPPELYSRILSFAIDVPKTNFDYWRVIFEVYKFHSWEIFLFEKLRKGETPYELFRFYASWTLTEPRVYKRCTLSLFETELDIVTKRISSTAATCHLTDKLFELDGRPPLKKKKRSYSIMNVN